MIHLTNETKILLATGITDFRKGIDALCGLCRNGLKEDPSSGTVFAFINRSKTQVRMLAFDGTGFWLMSKRLSTGKFPWWPKQSKDTVSHLEAKRLKILLWGQNPWTEESQGSWQEVG